MEGDVWEHVRRFLLFWAVVAVLLVVASVAVYWGDLGAALSSSATSLFELTFTSVLIVGGIVWLLRMIF